MPPTNPRIQSIYSLWIGFIWFILVRENHGYLVRSNPQRYNKHFCLAMKNGGDQSVEEECLPERILSFTPDISRRRALGMTTAILTTSLPYYCPQQQQVAMAATTGDTENDDAFVQRGNGFAYRFVPPSEMEPGAKPVKTHLFEINWKSTTTPKYTFGITIDPVRIQSLKEFGTPEEVAAKVVLAEVNRDGVFDVTLVKDPVKVEEDGTLSYILNYLSQGKRGDKRFVAKFCIQNQRLYALTAQVAEADYNSKEEELMQAVKSFRVLQ